MKVPISWLRQYVDCAIPAAELAHRLTMAGVEVGEITEIGGWHEVFVGQVAAVRPHPNADRLRLCTVSTGGAAGPDAEVVCGAPNVAAGQRICFARAGANLVNAHSGRRETLAPATIRGVQSQGMICSELELGLGDDHSGIIVLPADAPLGAPLADYLGDSILDLELTPNRLDCLSLLGVAHEVAALTGGRVTEPPAEYPEQGPPIGQRVHIQIADPDLCRRYTAALIDGVTIGESPAWLQQRLTRAGLRPINNVVDVTNFVMLEYNQPLHAFDFHRVQEAQIIVRRARPGEQLTTLEGAERTLHPDNLVIADARDAIGLGGVIGGANSEIGPETTAVLLESATFDAANNRRTAQSFGLRTEATLRFEKGLRPELAPIALRRAAALIIAAAGGTAAPGIIDVYPEPPAGPPVVGLSMARLRQLLGMELDWGQVGRTLDALGFDHRPDGEERLAVTIPYWRNDINIEEDLVEEIVRIIGYDAVPTTMLATPIPFQTPAPALALRERVKDLLAAAGMQEIINYPLARRPELEAVGAYHLPAPSAVGGDDAVPGDADTAAVGSNDADAAVDTDAAAAMVEPLRIANPLSAEHRYLRTTLQAGLLSTLAANLGHGAGPFRLFEVGRVFRPRPDDLPEETETAAAVLAGARRQASWLADGGAAAGAGGGTVDFYDAKGAAEWLLQRLEIAAEFAPGQHPAYHPGRCAVIRAALPPGHAAAPAASRPGATAAPATSRPGATAAPATIQPGDDGAVLGFVGELHPEVRQRMGLESAAVAGFELYLPALLAALPASERRFIPLPRYPEATRDLALLAPAATPAAAVTARLLRHRLLVRAELFDHYTGENIAPGQKSLAFHLAFQSPDRTLTNEEVTRSIDGLLRALNRELGITRRDG